MPLLTLISSFGLIDNPIANTDTFLLFGVKVMFIIAGILYVLFAILVTRQISIMSRTLETTNLVVIKLLGLAHLVLALFILIYFFTVL